MTHQVNDKFSQPLYNDDGNICSDDVNVILEMHADNTNNCIDYFSFNDDVPSCQKCGSMNTVQLSDNDIINMPANVHDSNNNDILSTIDPDRYINHGMTNCHYFDSNEFNTKFNNTDRFSIFHTNLRSSKHNINQLLCYLNSIDMDFTIIGLSETWGKSIHIDMQNIPGYKHYYCIRGKNRNSGGTSLYVKSTIPFKRRSDLEFKKSIFESSVIEIDKHVFHNRHNIIVGIFHRSRNSTLSIFNDSLEKLFNVIQKEKKYAYIMGDFNVNTINKFTGTTPQCQQFTNIFLVHYYRKLIHLPTRVSGNSRSILDNIYTNHPLHEENGDIMTDITDTVCEDPEPIINRKFRERRDYNINYIVKFKNRLRSVNWEEKFASGSALHNFTEFYNSFKFLFDLTFPKEKIIIKYDNKNPWINNKLKADIVQKEKLLIISKKTPTELNIQKYKSFKNRNLADQRATERAHYKEQFGIFSDDLKKSFRVLRKLICKDNGHNMTNNIDFVIDKSIVSDKTKIANGFNDYFVNVGSTLSSNIHCNVNLLSYVEANPNSMVIPNLTVGDIINVISSLNNSSAGYDEMPASILKKCIDEYITPITYLVNLSIRQGTFPNELKLAKVIPIFKSCDEQLINNYRPILVLPFFSQIYEKVMANFLINFLDANGILSNF